MPRRRPRRQSLVLAALACLLAVSACTGSDGPGDAGASPSTSSTASAGETPSGEGTGGASTQGALIRSTFFGLHDGRVTQGITPEAPAGALRFWDSATSWRDIETAPGRYTWAPLDTAVRAAHAAGARPLLVLGQTPTFHASKPQQEAAYGPGAASMPELDAWRRYVTAVAQRYGDRIDYQVWNEANIAGYWNGRPRQIARVTLTAADAIRRVVPEATVVAPPFALRLPTQQSYFADFWSLQRKGLDLASAVDAVAVHLYPPAEGLPEAQVRLLDQARAVLARDGVDLPVWNTEINFGLLGGPQPPAIPATRQRAFLMRTYLLNAGLGVQRVYWYRWDLAPIANTLLTTPDFSSPTLAGRAYSTIRTWLDGTRVEPCRAEAGVWSCTATKGQETRTFWWKPRGPATRVSVGEDATSWTDADGAVTRCRSDCRVPVGETPVMVTSR